MSTPQDAPALPVEDTVHPNGQIQYGTSGLTAREHAAIQLRVPTSGTDWLDEMITESLRNEFAGQALAAAGDAWKHASLDERYAISRCKDTVLILQRDGANFIANMSATIADAMLAHGKKGQP